MTRVLGLDLSLTATGVAVLDDDPPGGGVLLRHHTITSKGHRDDSLADRNERLYQITHEIDWKWVEAGFDLAAIEGPSIMSKGGSNWDRAGLWWRVVSMLLATGHPVVVVPPAQVKQFATGKGNADKTQVAVAMSKAYPDAECANDNEWDALTLATIAARRLGMDLGDYGPTRAHHAAVLDRITWPADLPTLETP